MIFFLGVTLIAHPSLWIALRYGSSERWMAEAPFHLQMKIAVQVKVGELMVAYSILMALT